MGPAPSRFPPTVRRKVRASFPPKAPGEGPSTPLMGLWPGSRARASGTPWAPPVRSLCLWQLHSLGSWARMPSVSREPGARPEGSWVEAALAPACGTALPGRLRDRVSTACLWSCRTAPAGCPIPKVKALASFPGGSSTLMDSGSRSWGRQRPVSTSRAGGERPRVPGRRPALGSRLQEAPPCLWLCPSAVWVQLALRVLVLFLRVLLWVCLAAGGGATDGAGAVGTGFGLALSPRGRWQSSGLCPQQSRVGQGVEALPPAQR